MQTATRPIQTHFEFIQSQCDAQPQEPAAESILDFETCIQFLNEKGRELYGNKFSIDPVDYEVIFKILVYTIKDVRNAEVHNINLSKGILLSGPVGCGKTALMRLINFINPKTHKYLIKSCREVSYDFVTHGYEMLHKYTYQSFKTSKDMKVPQVWCFDDLGTENNLKYYGNECNVMAEILFSRYDLFVQRGMLTHITTNLNAQEIEDAYGNRIRSRMREMFNLISFNENSRDKRV
ncbi:MAG: ATPase [Cytophaga sp.]|uniref:ATPase n=1 Tax=Cytophaga sp. TaxID=29535 RepID=UPI003F7F683D